MMGLTRSKDPESYAGGSVATGKPPHGGLVKGDDPNAKQYHSPLGCGSGLKMKTSPRKILF
jgi:hypothetical protein